MVQSLRGIFIHETKTDAIDAFIIAEVLRICRQRFYVVDMAADIKRKVIALLDQVFPVKQVAADSVFNPSPEILSALLKQYIEQLKSF